jgi:hypothetical protein
MSRYQLFFCRFILLAVLLGIISPASNAANGISSVNSFVQEIHSATNKKISKNTV